MKLAELTKKETDYDFNPICYYLKTFNDSFTMPAHSHGYFEIMYAEYGSFYIDVQCDGKVRRYNVLEGQFILIDSDTIHKIETPEKCKIDNFETAPSNSGRSVFHAGKILSASSNTVRLLTEIKDFIILNDTENVLSVLKSLHCSLHHNENDAESYYLIQSLIIALFISIGRCYVNRAPDAQSVYVAKMLQTINNDLTADLSPHYFAKQFDVSPSYLHRLFKKSTGQTIIEYVNKKRIEISKNILSNTDLPIIEIAMSVGFNTRQNFCQIFKKYVGVSPLTYRNNEKNKRYCVEIEKSEIDKQKSYSF